MCPSERRDVRQQLLVGFQYDTVLRGDSLPEMLRFPIDDGCREQVHPGHAVVLSFDGPITGFALAPDAQGVFQGVMSLAPVETDLGKVLHIGVEQPVDDDEGALDAAYFAQGHPGPQNRANYGPALAWDHHFCQFGSAGRCAVYRRLPDGNPRGD